ncbi:MAG: DUF4367 domain-containing protein [Ruminococcaceae bacterium]|nr:DUF4367 domain-containing protein [Oscillospiraceae bacterium]
MTDKKARSVMDAYAAAWLDSLPAPASSPHHAFSASHHDAMRPLRRQAAKPFRSMSRAARFALAAAVIAALLTAAAFSADMPLFRTLRLGLVTVYQQINPLYTEQHFETDVPDDGEMKTVTFGWLPEGMEETERRRTSELSNHERIIFDNADRLRADVFRIREDSSFTLQYDSENVQFFTVEINGQQAQLGVKGDRLTLQWSVDNYLLRLTTHVLDQETLCRIAENIVLN